MAGFAVANRGLTGSPRENIAAGQLPYTAVQASRYLTPSAGDDSAAMVAALTSFAPFAYPTVVLGAGTFQWNSQVPALARSQPCRIVGAGQGKTIIKLSGGAPRAFDLGRVADYDLFQDIEISDLTVDCNNVGGQHHCVLGMYVAGVYPTSGQRINIDNVRIRRVNVINAPTDANISANHRLGIVLESYHPGVNEATRTQVTRVVVEDFEMLCGNGGVFCAGVGPPGGVNILVDDITYLRCKHVMPVPKTTAGVALTGTFAIPVTSTAGFPSSGQLAAIATNNAKMILAYTSTDATDFLGCTVVSGSGTALVSGAGVGYPLTSNFQVGSRGIGGRCTLRDMTAGGSGDNSLEINALTDALVENYKCTDDINAAFVQINYQNPLDLLAQRIVYRDCMFRITDPASNGEMFLPGTSTSIANLQQVVIERAKLVIDGDAQFNGSGKAIGVGLGGRTNVQKVVVKGFKIYHTVSAALAAGVTANWFYFDSALTGCEVSIDDVDIVVAGAITGGQATNTRLFSLSGADTVYTLRDIRPDFNVTGLSGASLEGVALGVTATSVVRGDISRLVYKTLTTGLKAGVRVVTANAGLDSNHIFTLNSCDFSKLPSALEVVHDTLSTSGPFVFNAGTRWRTFPKASAAMGATNFASATFTTAVGNQYIGGTAAEIHFANGSGAAITAIAVSKDGVTYENAYEQASGVMANDVLVPVDNGDFVKVTFATTQPTTRVRFRNN